MAEQDNPQLETRPDASHPDQISPTEERFKPKNIYFSFTGSGSEYFSIWITNVFFSIITLGIYSPWAKVRRLKYFYQNTSLDGNRFDFHGNPIAILKGRLIIFLPIALFFVFNFLGSYGLADIPTDSTSDSLPSGSVGSLFFLLILLLLFLVPFLIVKSLQFKTKNTSYRGLRFRFTGTVGKAFTRFLLLPFLTLFVGLLTPLTHQQIKEYIASNSWYGNTKFRFTATIGNFSGTYFLLILLSIAIIVAAITVGVILGGSVVTALSYWFPEIDSDRFLSADSFIFAIFGIYLFLYFIFWPISVALFQNLTWNHTLIGPCAFHSKISPAKLCWIYFTNLLGIICTVGLFIPFAQTRIAKYRMSCLSLMLNTPFESFAAGSGPDVSALGDAFTDWFDIDIAF